MPIATLSHESVTCVMKTAAKRWSEFAVELSTRVSGSSANTIATSRSATARRTATRARVAEDEAAARLEPALRLPGRVLLGDARGVQVLHHGCRCRSERWLPVKLDQFFQQS